LLFNNRWNFGIVRWPNENRILNLQENSLVNFWDTWFRPMPPQCNGKPQSGKKKELSPLSLKNLTGAFLVLLVGMSLSLLAFLGEKVFLDKYFAMAKVMSWIKITKLSVIRNDRGKKNPLPSFN
jgi:hypothetical protein